jgi:hypothetical protein
MTQSVLGVRSDWGAAFDAALFWFAAITCALAILTGALAGQPASWHFHLIVFAFAFPVLRRPPMRQNAAVVLFVANAIATVCDMVRVGP